MGLFSRIEKHRKMTGKAQPMHAQRRLLFADCSGRTMKQNFRSAVHSTGCSMNRKTG
jgi:hypothetical protein